MPEFYDELFSPETITAIVSVVAFSKLIRNMLGGMKGWAAIVVVVVVSFVYSFIQYGSLGIEYALGIGLFAALAASGVYKTSQLIGEEVGRVSTTMKSLGVEPKVTVPKVK